MSESKKNIAAKLVNVMNDCQYVPKNGENTFHKYRYAMAADVLDKVNKSLVKNKLIAITEPELVDFKDITNAKGNTEHLATVKTILTIIDSESGESIQACGWGSGQDTGDKAVMKAQTASLKYVWMMLLQISTGDDPEADSGVDERAAGNPKKPEMTQSEQQPSSTNDLPKCPDCNKPIATTIEQAVKVEKWCKEHPERFNGKVYCQSCQAKHKKVS